MTQSHFRLRNASSRPATRRGLLMAGASLFVLAIAQATPAQAGSLKAALSSARVSNAAAAAAVATAASRTAGAVSQAANANLTASLNSLKAALAAQKAMAGVRSSFNGLGPGALQPVTNPNTTTDGLTDWTGADLPTETVTGDHHDVTVEQTQSRAVLSWESFNVGSDTTLTFDQQGNANWIALNRVVGDTAAPSQILGQVKADGQVLVINQNGIVFGAGAQVNVHSLIASTAEIGRSFESDNETALTIAQRNAEFLEYGLTGYAESQGNGSGIAPNYRATFSGTTSGYDAETAIHDPGKDLLYNYRDAEVEVEAGAALTAGDGGMIALIAPTVTNAGHLSAADGQVSLIGLSGRTGETIYGMQWVSLNPSNGGADAIDPDIRGLIPVTDSGSAYLDADHTATSLVRNSGVIEAERGYVSLGGQVWDNTNGSDGGLLSNDGTVVNTGILRASTGVSANGVIDLHGKDITLGTGSLILIDADGTGDTVAQDEGALSNFKTSKVRIGSDISDVVMEGGARIVVPSGDVTIGVETDVNRAAVEGSILIKAGALIDVSGLKDVYVPMSHYNLKIALYGNELADSGGYQDSFLYGQEVWIDARRSGVREDGVAWVGSPLISAAAYYEAIGVTAPEVLTQGGNVTLNARHGSTALSPTTTANVTVAEGAVVDMSGGWVTYQGGTVKTTQVLNSAGQVVDIGNANPLTDTYVAVHGGVSRTSDKWGIVETWKTLGGGTYGTLTEPAYTEGRDAGTLTLRSPMVTFEGDLDATAHAGLKQIAGGRAGTGSSGVSGDLRKVQGARAEIPAGGMLFVEAEAAIRVDHGEDGGESGGEAKTVVLSDTLLSESGLSQVSLWSRGAITVTEDAEVALRPGGVFDALAGRALTVAGTISAPSGTIILETYDGGAGSIFDAADDARVKGAFDITVTGTLSVAGLWVNDLGKAGADLGGDAWMDGGSITMVSADSLGAGSAVTKPDSSSYDPDITTTTDISGSILLADATLIDLSGGGRVKTNGTLDLSGKGGDLSLINQTAFHTGTGITSDAKAASGGIYGTLSGFRARYTYTANNKPHPGALQINPDAVTSTVRFDADSIRAAGFSGGGTFTLWAPDIAFGSGSADDTATATAIPLDFFSTAGFGAYSLTSNKTELIDNTFVDTNGDSLGGKNALLQTQTFRVRDGEVLSLTQSLLPIYVSGEQRAALLGLETGGDVGSVLTASVPTEAWDQKAVDLTLDGMVELVVEAGGTIIAAPGATLTVAKLKNQGTIRLPGGHIRQRQTVVKGSAGLAMRTLDDLFTVEDDGTIVETRDSRIEGETNGQLAGNNAIYRLGEMDEDEGIVLAEDSVTDLSGTSVHNPYALNPQGGRLTTGRLYDGGSITFGVSVTGLEFYRPSRRAVRMLDAKGERSETSLTIAGGATVDLSGTADTYQETVAGQGVVSRAVWSNGGMIATPNVFSLSSDARITAQGGAAGAQGGTLELADVILTQDTADAPRELSADQIMASGFSTLSVLRSLGSDGDVTLTLDRALYVTSRPMSVADTVTGGAMRVTVGAGGDLDITAPYIGLISRQDTLAAATGTGGHEVRLHATRAFDVTGAVRFTDAVSSVALTSDGDLRLIGVADPEIVYEKNGSGTTLTGTVSVAGDLTLAAAQVYPTTGTTFAIDSRADAGTITFARSTQTLPNAPYSAGGDLTVTAGTIVQGGVLRVPMGRLTLTATDTLTLTDGSYTEVSANGLIIPYGTTTDRKEWYFTPIGGSALTAPPEKVLTLSGDVIDMAAGAVVNVSGGGDLTAYEFAAGTGGSRDVLSSINSDPYTSTTGCTYQECALAYAIVPGLSDQAVAAYDPVYSADYGVLSSATGVGRRVRLDLGAGLRWYTLLPARYATLPGGMLVVQQAANGTSVPVGTTTRKADGTLLAAGVYGDALSGAADPTIRLFAVQGRDVYSKYSSISVTSGNTYFATLAGTKGAVTPRLAVDAGRLALNAASELIIDTAVRSAAGTGGRGAQVDVGGSVIHIVSALPSDISGALYVTADSLTNLGAESLLVGATRTEQADGTTRLDVTAGSLTVDNDADHALKAAEIVLASTGDLTVADGAAITATGTLSDTNDGAYVLGGGAASGTGALLRVANGVERLTSRANFGDGATLTVGAATLSGTAMLFDSSGAASLDAGMTIREATTVALGAGRIGLGMDPEDYAGMVLTEGLRSLLTQAGGALTLRSQTAIDFADGTYAFGDIRLDAATLTGTEGGAVTLSGDTVTLGNVGAEGTVCGDCTENGGSLSIEAREILFAGGAMATQATVTTNAATAKLRHDTTIILPKGTLTSYGPLDRDTPITVSAGTVVDLVAGTGLLTDASGQVTAGSEITAANLGLTLASGASIVFTEATTATSSQGRTNTLDAGNAYTLNEDTTVTVPSGSALVLDADVGVTGTDFFGGGVSLTASEGIFATGAGGGLDTGAAALTLHTPYLGDRAAPETGGGTAIPDLALTTRGILRIDAVGAAAVDLETLGGIPGAGLSLRGDTVTISGTTVHATAGTVTVAAESSLALTDGAVVEAPGYTATFGDATDSATRNAPGGTIRLIAEAGDIALAAGTLVSVGGGVGDAGRLELSAAQGAITLDGTLDGRGATGGTGGVLAVETLDAIDLTDLNGRAGADGFTGGFEVHTHSGDLTLDAGRTLRSGAVRLVADGGLVVIGGTIDTSGVNGGAIGLYGSDGVTLTETARLDARSTGYAQTDPRRAHASDVTLGTDFRAGTTSTGADGVIGGTSGTITIAQGAVIDLSVANTENRVIKLDNGLGYHYVAADTAGTLTLRAPVIDDGAGHQTVDIHVASAETVTGAGSVVVEGFRRWDLAQVAASGTYAGVTIDPATGTVTLDARTDLDSANDDGTRTAVGGVNFLGDEGGGTLPDFVQSFDISAADGGLGGLIYHARPGLDLVHDGNITLASTWNFGAGVVDVNAAIAAGVMTETDGAASVVAGREGEVLGRFTRMIYRTGGSAFGEAPILALRAGGNLHLDGSLADGFFQFSDPDIPGSGGVGAEIEGMYGIDWSDFSFFLESFDLNLNSSRVLNGLTDLIVMPGGGGGAAYNNAGNSVSAETAGDTLASSVLFPQACNDTTCSDVSSTSYTLVAGATVERDAASLLVPTDPADTDPGTDATVSISAVVSRDMSGSAAYDFLFPTVCTYGAGCSGSWGDADAFLSAFGGDKPFVLRLYQYGGGNIVASMRQFQNDINSGGNNDLNLLIQDYGGLDTLNILEGSGGEMKGPSAIIAYFLSHYDFGAALKADIELAAAEAGQDSPFPSSGNYTLTMRNMIRTGTGDITIAAAGDVDLTGGAGRARYEDAVAVYTTGVKADTGTVSARDVATGRTASVTLGAHMGSAGLYLSGGGDITLTAGRDVLGTSVTYLTPEYSDGGSVLGTSLQWFAKPSGTSGDEIAWADQELDPAGFTTGVGALAGGDVTVTAGRDVDDLAVVATPAVRTVDVTLDPGTDAETTALGIEVLGDDAVALTAGRDLRGGLAYVTSGRLSLDAGRDITDAGWSPWRSANGDKEQIVPLLRILNATAEARARGAITLTWDDTLSWSRLSEGNWYGPRAALSVVANGDIAMTGQTHTSGQALVALPGSVTLAALTGDLSFAGRGLFLLPAPDGQLALLAGGRIGGAERTVIVMDDADPADLPSPFRTRLARSRGITFPVVASSTTEAERRLYHNQDLTHAGDIRPVQVMAGGDITTLTLSLPKQARVVAGGDIVDMMVFGQNLTATDITRIAAAGAITATSTLVGTKVRLNGNTFVIGGPGDLFLEAGGDMGPFLNSARVKGSDDETFTLGGGVLSVGYDWNPWLKPAVTEAGGGANLTVMFGLGDTGPDYAALADVYVNPANVGALVDGDGYADALVAWLEARYKRSGLSEAEAYAAFQALSPVERQLFLLSEVYFTELKQPAVPDGDSYQQYSRGYRAVNTLFPAAHGYTANGLQGGAVDSDRVRLGDLDLRLATLQTTRGGDVRVLGPGGDVLAGSVVRTATQAERRSYDPLLYAPFKGTGSQNLSIPTGLEGILTLRGGVIETFTDGNLVLNQSRVFTQRGGDIVMWSSNGDLNAGEGPKTTVTYTPRAVRFDWNAYGEVDEAGSVAGAGIASFGETDAGSSSDVYLLAPRGTVDAGDAGIRVAGNISILAYEVRNADNIQVGGDSFGVPVVVAPNVGALTAASDSAGKASDAANQAAKASRQATRRDSDLPSIITFQVIGYGGGGAAGGEARGGDDGRRAQTSRRPAPAPAYDPDGAVRFSAPEDGAADRS